MHAVQQIIHNAAVAVVARHGRTQNRAREELAHGSEEQAGETETETTERGDRSAQQ